MLAPWLEQHTVTDEDYTYFEYGTYIPAGGYQEGEGPNAYGRGTDR